jgi:hypothetical protein
MSSKNAMAQRALILARIYPEPAKLKRKGSGSLQTKELGLNSGLLSQARAIVNFAPELVEALLVDPGSFANALATARIRRSEKENADRVRKQNEAELDKIRAAAPDLAVLVDGGQLKLRDAMAALDRRLTEDRCQAATRRVFDIVQAIASARATMRDFDPAMWPDKKIPPTRETFMACADALKECAALCPNAEARPRPAPARF